MIMMQAANGLGLQASIGKDYCQVTMQFPGDTIPKWVKFFSIEMFQIYKWDFINNCVYELG